MQRAQPFLGSGQRNKSECEAGFTRLDFVVAVATAAVLILLPLAASPSSRNQSRAATCGENLRQLTQAWLMYAGDNGGKLAPNRYIGGLDESPPNWVYNNLLDYSGRADNVDTSKMTNSHYSALTPYIPDPSLYRCPEDVSSVRYQGMLSLRNRSYSMNAYVGTLAIGWQSEIYGRKIANMQSVNTIRQPENTLLLIEEHPDSIDDAIIYFSLAQETVIIDFPGSYHYYGANLAFTDGHIDLWRWRDSRTSPKPRFNNSLLHYVASSKNPDMSRLAKVTSYFLE